MTTLSTLIVIHITDAIDGAFNAAPNFRLCVRFHEFCLRKFLRHYRAQCSLRAAPSLTKFDPKKFGLRTRLLFLGDQAPSAQPTPSRKQRQIQERTLRCELIPSRRKDESHHELV